MNGIYRMSLVLLGCVVVGGIIGSTQLALSANPKEVKLVESLLTHMGRLPSEHVMLEASLATPPPGCDAGVSRIFPDGSKDPSSFIVPSGKVLILTDIVGVIDEDVTWIVGDVVVLRALIKGPLNQDVEILRAAGVLFSDSANSGTTAVNIHSQSGGLAGSGTSICLRVAWSRPGGSGLASVRDAHLEGYLIDE